MKAKSNFSTGCAGFQEQTTILSTFYPGSGWTQVKWSNCKGTTLGWRRGETSVDYDLTAMLNQTVILSLIDTFLGSACRSSSLYMKWIPGKNLPYKSSARADDMFLRMTFDFRYCTPWYCSGAKGNIDYYIDCQIDESGALAIQFHGWGFQFKGGGPFRKDQISAALHDDIPDVMDILQEQFKAFPELSNRKSLSLQS